MSGKKKRNLSLLKRPRGSEAAFTLFLSDWNKKASVLLFPSLLYCECNLSFSFPFIESSYFFLFFLIILGIRIHIFHDSRLLQLYHLVCVCVCVCIFRLESHTHIHHWKKKGKKRKGEKKRDSSSTFILSSFLWPLSDSDSALSAVAMLMKSPSDESSPNSLNLDLLLPDTGMTWIFEEEKKSKQTVLYNVKARTLLVTLGKVNSNHLSLEQMYH